MSYADATWLIAMRAVLGLGAALVMPATLATVTGAFPADQRPKAVGTWAGVAGASAILGLLTSGLVLEQWSWRAVFALNIVLAVVAIIATLRIVPESADPHAPPLDWIGAALSVGGLAVLVFAIIEAPTDGWGSAASLSRLGAGLVLLGAFVRWELCVPSPLLDPRLFRLRGFASGTLSLTLQFFAFFGFLFILLQYLQLVLGDSPLVAAISLIPMAAGLMPAARVIAPRLARRLGAARTSALGLLLAAGAFAWLATLDATSGYWPLVAGLLPLGAGMGLAMTPATSAVTNALPADKQGVGSAMNDLARELGGALGIAVLASVLQSAYRASLDVSSLSDTTAAHARSSLAIALRLGPSVAQSAETAFVDGMHYALMAAAAAVCGAAIAVAALARR
jgi:MFS family permease